MWVKGWIFCLSIILYASIAEAACRDGERSFTRGIIEVYQGEELQGIVLVAKDSEPLSWALPEGEVQCGEKAEEAFRRVMQAEIGLDIVDLEEFASADSKDENVYIAKTFTTIEATKGVMVASITDISWDQLVPNHAKIIKEYVKWVKEDCGCSAKPCPCTQTECVCH